MTNKAQNLYEHLLSSFELPNYAVRRSVLNENMNSLLDREINCFSCSGLCCTFVSNSMQTDPVQTLELYLFLKDNNRWNDELIAELKEVIRNNRLDYEIQTGAGSMFRRTYTCPFYNKGPKGCSISPEWKPFGCLGFNANSSGASEGSDCHSDLELLQKREDLFEGREELANHYLKEKLDLYWDKLPMPVALLELNKKLISEEV
ncbi:hypothetical protein [Halobacteriovorax marinus]|uniref:hypothetical protein n=1 Tax=Halobacteriovorax marinus TaxID=97084 RepID=UPI0012FDB61C|nr:hypothetical protein [Halobacteriovorax marinus]